MNNQPNMNQYDIKQAADAARREKFVQIVEQSDYVLCDDCGTGTFVQALFVKKVSGLLIGGGVDLLHPMAVYMCTGCGKILTGEGDITTLKVEDFNDQYGREYTDEEKSALLPKTDVPAESTPVEQPTQPSSIITSETESKPSNLIL